MDSRHSDVPTVGAVAGHTLNYLDPLTGEHLEVLFGYLPGEAGQPPTKVAYLKHGKELLATLPVNVFWAALQHGWEDGCPNA